MNFPQISIVIPTFNSESTLKRTLDSIRKQTYPETKVETLVVDGGSSDKTLEIARRYKCRILPNPKVDLIYAKHIGFLKAKGKYLMFLDSDEVLKNYNSLRIKVSAFKKDKKVKAVILTGYKSPEDYPAVNAYINEFGDPFSFFMYRESKGEKFLIKDFKSKYKKVYENKGFVIFDFSAENTLPLIELWAGGCMIDLEFCKRQFPDIKQNPALIAHLFYLFIKHGFLIAITKNDPTIHYSAASLGKYLKKLRSRIISNVFFTSMGESGFSGREMFESDWLKFKKYLFTFYTSSLIFPAIDSFHLLLTRKRLIYLLHLPLCIYTAVLILYFISLKFLGLEPEIKSYGN